MPFQIPGPEDRTAVMGGTGTGKTTFGAWILSKQNLRARPWVALDYKDEILWDQVGDPPMRELKMGSLPGKNGLWRLRVRPDQDDALEDWLWKIWQKGDIGLFCDEASLIPQRSAFKAVLRQGRSKLIPVIACTQRPVGCEREIFTESQYASVFRLDDKRDYQIVKGFCREAQIEGNLPPYHSFWYDKRQAQLSILKPVPDGATIAARLKETVPYKWSLWG